MNNNYIKEALDVCKFSLEKLAITGTEPEITMKNFEKWVQEVTDKKIPIFIGWPVAFDWMFVTYYFENFLGRSPFYYNQYIDMRSLCMGYSGKSWKDSNPEDFVQEPVNKNPHNALQDAIAQAEIFERLMKKIRQK